MTLAQLHETLAGLTYQHPSAGTNVESVVNDGTDVIFVAYEPDGLADLKHDYGEQEKTVKRLEKELEEANEKLEDAQALLAEVNDGTSTIVEYRDDAKRAREERDAALKTAEANAREVAEWRKRKGVSPTFYATRREVTEFLYTQAHTTILAASDDARTKAAALYRLIK